MSRRLASREHSERVSRHFRAQDDLYARCRHCGCLREGTFEQVTQPCECHGTED